jgi:PAS domain S-box-containing protein
VNRAWETALGLSAAELQGKGWMGFIHPDDLGTVASALSGLRVGPVDDLELRFRSKSGEYRWLVGSAAPVPGRDILFAAVRDLTERKQLEKQLREKNAALLEQNQRVQTATRMKSEFLANMSHELRSPLNGIIGFSELLCDGKLGPLAERPREFIGRIQASAMHLLSLINGILDLSKVEAGRLEFRPEPVIVSEIMVEVIGILGAIAVKKGIRIQTEIDAGANRVFTDPGKLKQILHNYLSNALKFTAPGGSIIVRLKAEGGRDFRLEVADSGPGILKEDIGRLFVEFQQLDGSRAKFHQGTGLGLALTKRLVEAQGGTVGVESEVGRGSTFFAVLPRKPVRDSSLTALAQILAIEHDPEQRSLVIDTLEAAGYRVETASTCREAFTICQAAHFDAIALDPLLPDGSGWDLMRQIRSLEKHRATPIIAVSMPQKDDTAVEDQVQGFLMKPFGSAELLEALKHAGVPTGPKSV